MGHSPSQVIKMKRSFEIGTFLLIVVLSVVKADSGYYLNANQVFCNCGEAENNFYHRFSAAEEACSKEPHEGGYGSCLAVEMGFLSHDCRSTDSDAILEALSGHEEFYEGCIVEPFPTSLNETLGWQWPGSYPYAAMDTAFYAFMGCLKTLYIGTCQQAAIDYFAC